MRATARPGMLGVDVSALDTAPLTHRDLHGCATALVRPYAPDAAALIRAETGATRHGASRDGSVFYRDGTSVYLLDVDVFDAMLDDIGDAAEPALFVSPAREEVLLAKAQRGVPAAARLAREHLPADAVRAMARHRLAALAASGDGTAAGFIC